MIQNRPLKQNEHDRVIIAYHIKPILSTNNTLKDPIFKLIKVGTEVGSISTQLIMPNSMDNSIK